jgi:hypothetical protein
LTDGFHRMPKLCQSDDWTLKRQRQKQGKFFLMKLASTQIASTFVVTIPCIYQ